MSKPKITREKGNAVDLDDVKYQTRVFILPKISIDLLPVWWKYYQRGTATVGAKDRASYACKWLFFEFHIESVRMKRRQ